MRFIESWVKVAGCEEAHDVHTYIIPNNFPETLVEACGKTIRPWRFIFMDREHRFLDLQGRWHSNQSLIHLL